MESLLWSHMIVEQCEGSSGLYPFHGIVAMESYDCPILWDRIKGKLTNHFFTNILCRHTGFTFPPIYFLECIKKPHYFYNVVVDIQWVLGVKLYVDFCVSLQDSCLGNLERNVIKYLYAIKLVRSLDFIKSCNIIQWRAHNSLNVNHLFSLKCLV